jgi:hypothetical protein
MARSVNRYNKPTPKTFEGQLVWFTRRPYPSHQGGGIEVRGPYLNKPKPTLRDKEHTTFECYKLVKVEDEQPVAYVLRSFDDAILVQAILIEYLKKNQVFDKNRDMAKEGYSFANGSAFHNVFTQNGRLDEFYYPKYKHMLKK